MPRRQEQKPRSAPTYLTRARGRIHYHFKLTVRHQGEEVTRWVHKTSDYPQASPRSGTTAIAKGKRRHIINSYHHGTCSRASLVHPQEPPNCLSDRPPIDAKPPSYLSLGHTQLLQPNGLRGNPLIDRRRHNLDDRHLEWHDCSGSNSSRSRPPTVKNSNRHSGGSLRLGHPATAPRSSGNPTDREQRHVYGRASGTLTFD